MVIEHTVSNIMNSTNRCQLQPRVLSAILPTASAPNIQCTPGAVTPAAASPAGFEARGLIFGAPLALALGVPFVPLRKPGKLPGVCAGSCCNIRQHKQPPACAACKEQGCHAQSNYALVGCMVQRDIRGAAVELRMLSRLLYCS